MDISKESREDDMFSYAKHVVGPIAYKYTLWVINEAQKRKIKKLWFLARDGYLLRIIADKICRQRGIDIENRYLYCSRSALRMPAYHLIGDEAYEYLFSRGYYCTPLSLLARADIIGDEAVRLLNSLGYSDYDAPMSYGEFDMLCEALRVDSRFTDWVEERSKSLYPAAIDYLRCEGLLDAESVAIVDSGWTGSVQRVLRILLESAGYRGKIVGFYFGMYSDAKDENDGTFLTFYFNRRGSVKKKVMFNNNLLECMLAAPHPMTIRYKYSNGISTPQFGADYNGRMQKLIDDQIAGALAYVDEINLNNEIKSGAEITNRQYYNILKRSMIYPRKSEALLYSHFGFCDDVTESYSLSLAGDEVRKRVKEYSLLRRIIRKISGKGNTSSELLWVYGAIAYLPPAIRPWYRMNALTYDFLKAIKEKIKFKR